MKRYIETKDHDVYCIDDLDVGFSTFTTKDGKCISAEDVLRVYDEPVKNVYIIVDDDFDSDYYQESNAVYIEYEDTVPFEDGEFREKYLVTGCESEINSFLEEAKQHILDIEEE